MSCQRPIWKKWALTDSKPHQLEPAPIWWKKYERNAFVRLKANDNYWGGAPEFKSVTIKFVTDAAGRVAEVESGNAHVTLEMPYEEYDRLKGGALLGTAAPVSDIGMIFFNDIDAMTDPNVRKAAVMAVNKNRHRRSSFVRIRRAN